MAINNNNNNNNNNFVEKRISVLKKLILIWKTGSLQNL